MKLLLSGLLLASLCVLSSWSVSSGSFVVTQSADVSVTEGDTVDISCCWTGTAERERITVNWLKNQTEVTNEMNQKSLSVTKETSNCWNLTFSNITRKDSGRYICKVTVEVPFYNSFNGSGTVITVMTREKMKEKTEEDSYRMSTLINSLRCLPFLVLLLLLMFFYFRSRWARSQQHKPASLENISSSARRGENNQGEEETHHQRETLLLAEICWR